MKKIILFISAIYLISLGAFAQNMVINDGHGTTFSNGDTVILALPSMYKDSVVTVHFNAKNEGSTTFMAKVRRTTMMSATGSENSFCFGLGCYPPQTSLSEAVSMGVSDEKDIKAEYFPTGSTDVTIIRYSAFDVANVADSAWVYLYLDLNSATSIESSRVAFEISKAYPNPANNIVHVDYNFSPSIGKVQFMVSDVLGSIVKKFELTESNGKLNVATDNLENGVYFYSFSTESDVLSTKKLIVRH